MRMFKKLRVFLLVLVMLSCFCVGALADSNLRQIQAYINEGIAIRLDGQTQTMYDAQGKRVYPISYNGTTYVPIRAVSNMLGIDVEWDGANNTILLGDNDVVPKTKITDLVYYNRLRNSSNHRYEKVNSAMDNLGNTYIDPLRLMTSCESNYWETYMLTEDFSTFTGVLFIGYEDRDSRTTCNVRIYGDGELLYNSPTMTNGVKPVDFSVDIDGVDELKIEINGEWSSSYSWLSVYIANGVLE